MENIDEHITLIIGFIGHFWIWNFTYEVKTSYRPWENKGWKGTQQQEEVDIPRVAIFRVCHVVGLCCLCLNAFHHRVCFAFCHVNVSLYSVCIFLLFIWFCVINSVPRILNFCSKVLFMCPDFIWMQSVQKVLHAPKWYFFYGPSNSSWHPWVELTLKVCSRAYNAYVISTEHVLLFLLLQGWQPK